MDTVRSESSRDKKNETLDFMASTTVTDEEAKMGPTLGTQEEDEDDEEEVLVRNRRKTHRRRGKGKTKHQNKQLLPPPSSSRELLCQRIAREQAELICTKGYLAACWSLGIVLPQHVAQITPRSSPTLPVVTAAAPLLSGEEHIRFWLEDHALMSIVDRAAHDPASMESLVQDLALALPEISREINQSRLIQQQQEESSPWTDTDASVNSQNQSSSVSTSYIDFLLQSPHMSRSSSSQSQQHHQQHRRSSKSSKQWGSSSELASLSLAVASAAVDDEVELYKAWDPDRPTRVALVVDLAEKERSRRIAEREELTWKDRLDRAARIEWAVLASEAERQRRVQPKAQPEVVVVPLYYQDYEVICPYSVLGCDETLKRSELPAHFDTCAFRAEIIEARRLAKLRETYNPLDHVVVCPYTVVGCTHSCRRADLPAHLAMCPSKMEKLSVPSLVYEVVCPYTPLGCNVTCLRTEIASHLQECKFRPRTQQEDEEERHANQAYAIEAVEQERNRRVASPRERLTSMDYKTRGAVLEAIVAQGQEQDETETTRRTRRVSWVVQAAEIERMRKAEEQLIASSIPPPPPPPAPQVEPPDLGESPPGRKRIILEAALRIQRLHHAQWFPPESLDYVAQGRRTHVHTFHNHLEQQTRMLHKALHDEIERFGRDCALWELSCQQAVGVLMAKIRKVVDSTWRQYVSVVPPTVHIFGSFASELSVPGVSDLDLVVVPGAVGGSAAVPPPPPSEPIPLARSSSVGAPGSKPSSPVRLTNKPPVAPAPAPQQRRGSVGSVASSSSSPVLAAQKKKKPVATTMNTSLPPLSPPSSQLVTAGPLSPLRGGGPLSPQRQPVPLSPQRASLINPLPPTSPSAASPVVVSRLLLPPSSPQQQQSKSSSSPATASHRKSSSALGPLQLPPPQPQQPQMQAHRSYSSPAATSAAAQMPKPPPVSSLLAHPPPYIHQQQQQQHSTTTATSRNRRRSSAGSVEEIQDDTHMRNLMRDRLEAARRCRILGEALQQCSFLKEVRVIDTASVPLITMHTTEISARPLDIDMTVALSNHDGLAAAEFVRMLRTRFPPLMPMVRLLKAFLHSRNLANPFHGGLPSYALVLMATCSIIRSCERIGQHSTLSQGELVVDFLDLFGREFDPRTEAVCCNCNADLERMGIGRRQVFSTTELPLLYIAKRTSSLSMQSGNAAHYQQEVALVVDDPIRFGNNVGRSCFAFSRVQQAFAEVLASLLSHVVKNEALSRGGKPATTNLLERVFGVKPFSQAERM